MPAQTVGRPLVAETDKERCSATTKEATRCQLVKSVGSHFCLVHVAKNAVKAGKKTVHSADNGIAIFLYHTDNWCTIADINQTVSKN